ncbi:MAG TPA: SDR family oxidoreductase [Ignavibacteriaceae bacterium]|nr:SDR family oxidoreductase [Ignavibacteriaceae bacterium]
MTKIFKDKKYWAVILGGSSGLGLASAKKLAREGMNIFLVHRDRKSDLTEIEKHFKEIESEKVEFLSFNSDALKPENRLQIVSDIKKKLKPGETIRVLLHSIAKGNLKPMLSENDSALQNDDFHLTIDAMAISLYDWTKELYQNNLFSADARVISFTSEGNQKAWKNYAAVSAAKAALEAITRNIALEFAPYGIRANCIQAGVTDTQSFRLIPGSDQLKSITKNRNPFKRLTTPEDVANVVYLLTLDEASWINGTLIPADGGEHIS